MPESTALSPVTTRLRALLERGPALGDGALTEARSVGPELAGDVVASVLEAELSRPSAGGAAIRAAHLAHELRLARAVPALVRCLEVLPDFHRLHRAALAAVIRLGAAALDPLLASFDGCRTPQGRARIAEALSCASGEDDRIRAALVRMLEDDPMNGARLLAERGEWRAVDDLARAVDRLLLAPVGDCVVCSAEHLTAIAATVRVLGGALSDEQRSDIDDALERAEAAWTPFDESARPPPGPKVPARRERRPGRNAPCHCGSGKKYKNCHLAADERDARH